MTARRARKTLHLVNVEDTQPLNALPPSQATLHPLDRLMRAPENVRHIGADDDVLELADDIAGHGLLQSLIGYAGDDKLIYIVAGARRLSALNILENRKTVTPDFLVPVLIRDRSEAIELSLAENIARRNMNPVDEFMAFAALMEGGRIQPEDIAKRFGFTMRYVQQRLRLADLHAEILVALSERKITIDTAMAYASTRDTDLQKRVYDGQCKSTWKPHDPATIRGEIAARGIREDDQLVRYIGIEAYIEAGGEFEDDLFRELNGVRSLVDVALVKRLADTKAKSELAAVAKASDAVAAVPATGLEATGYNFKPPRAPEGTVFVETRGLDDAKWERARASGALVTTIAALNADGELASSGKGFFVPKTMLEKIAPPAPQQARYQQETEAQRIARARAVEVHLLAARLVLPTLSDMPGFEGRAFWPQRTYDAITGYMHPTKGAGHLVRYDVFVSNEEVEAKMAEAEVKLEEVKAAAAAAAEAKAARRAEAEAAVEAWQAEMIETSPAVIEIDGTPFFKWSNGAYADEGEMNPELVNDDYADVSDLVEYVETVGRSWATVEAWRVDADKEGRIARGDDDDDGEGRAREANEADDVPFEESDETEDAAPPAEAEDAAPAADEPDIEVTVLLEEAA